MSYRRHYRSYLRTLRREAFIRSLMALTAYLILPLVFGAVMVGLVSGLSGYPLSTGLKMGLPVTVIASLYAFKVRRR